MFKQIYNFIFHLFPLYNLLGNGYNLLTKISRSFFARDIWFKSTCIPRHNTYPMYHNVSNMTRNAFFIMEKK